MAPDPFFEESREQSQVKASIVAKYFRAWARVIIPWAKKGSGRLAYIDLFAGPGRYEDGTKSTPILVLETALQHPDLRSMLISIFNDRDIRHVQALEAEIRSIPNIKELVHEPKIYNEEVGDRIVEMFEEMHLVPTLFFVDPWGYKGLSLRLVNSVLKDWGCDCIFFFNYNRINMGLTNSYVTEHLDALFGAERGQKLRAQLESLSPDDRETAIVEGLAEALQDMGGRYVLPFRFKNEHGTRTKHHLIFVSKNMRGYEIMKEIMAGESSKTEQGVASFEYNPADTRNPILFELARPLDDLEGMLQEKFARQCLRMREVYDRHHVGLPYVKKNYKNALRHLEEEGKVVMRPAADKRIKRKGVVTVADDVEVIFRQEGDK